MTRLEAQPPARRPHAVPVTARSSIRGERCRMVRRAEGCFLGRKKVSTLDSEQQQMLQNALAHCFDEGSDTTVPS